MRIQFEEEANIYKELLGHYEELEQIVELAIKDGRLQTFEDRERFRKESRVFLDKIKGCVAQLVRANGS